MKNKYKLLSRQSWLVMMIWALGLALPVNALAQPPLVLTQPAYDCSTGAITFNTAGGDGTPITFIAPGITRSSATSTSGTVEQGLRNDPKPITIQATQSGKAVNYVFDFKAYCNNPSNDGKLVLLAPTVLCTSEVGAVIIFNTTGGDGTPITYSGSGLSFSSPTSNTATAFSCINPNKPILIQATQSGYTASYSLILSDACSSIKIFQPLSIKPIPDLTVTVGQEFQFELGPYIFDPNRAVRYVYSFAFTLNGLPEGIKWTNLSNNSPGPIPILNLFTYSGAPPLIPGVYTVTLTGSNGYCSPTVATFKITVVDKPVINPPTGNSLALSKPSYDCSTGAITFKTTGGDGTPITFIAPGITRSSATSTSGTVEQGLRNDPKPITIQAIQSGQTVSYTFDFKAYCENPPSASTLEMLAPSVTCGSNGYTTGATLVFNTRGGDDSPITYSIPGVTLSSPTSATALLFSCIDPNQILVLQAKQSGYTATYSFDILKSCPHILFAKPFVIKQIPDQVLSTGQSLGAGVDLTGYFVDPNFEIVPKYAYQNHFTFSYTGLPNGLGLSTDGSSSGGGFGHGLVVHLVGQAPSTPGIYTINVTASNGYCDPATSSFKIIVGNTSVASSLTLVAPSYNCSTGAITFNTIGGNGSVIEYQAAGITGWTTNPNQFVDKDSRTASDVEPFTLMARQSGQIVTYTWDLKRTCGRARVGVGESGTDFSVKVLGNPAHEQLRVLIEGAQGQPVQLRLIDPSGRLVESRTVGQASSDEEQTFKLNQVSPGLLLLQANTNTQVRTVKVIKQ